MNSRPAQPADPFDEGPGVGFDADDEFALPAQTVDAAVGGWTRMDEGPSAGPVTDAFGGFPPVSPPSPAAQAPAPAVDLNDDFDLPRTPASATAAVETTESGFNPVGAMIADVEQAMGDVGVPRITIHAFIERPETAEAIEKAAEDRRMARATAVIRTGGLAAAVELYQNQPTPSLIIVESLEPAPQLLALLDRLAEVCDPGTKVMVAGQTNDIALYRELMRRGVSEYLVPPLRPLAIIGAITGLYADPAQPFVGRQIAFVAAKGGVGASTLAHNFAYAMSETMQAATVIVDFDLAFGTAGLDFNQDPLQGVADALSQPDRLDSVLMDRMMARCSDRLSLFAAPANLDQDYDISPELFEDVAGKIRAAAPYIVLDLPHAWSAWKRKVLMTSDDLVVVATPDLASLRNAKNMIDLVRQSRPNDQPPRLVLNQVGVPGRPEIPVKDFGEALGLSPSLVLPFDPKLFGQAANNGQMLSEVNAKSKSAEGIDYLARLISRREAPVVAKTSLLSGLFKKK
jgi:pilus assembly protein CpaE